MGSIGLVAALKQWGRLDGPLVVNDICSSNGSGGRDGDADDHMNNGIHHQLGVEYFKMMVVVMIVTTTFMMIMMAILY